MGLADRSVVALVGAGGKTSLMWHLAALIAHRGSRVAAATTTHVAAGEEPAGTPLVAWPGDADALEEALGGGGPPLVTSGRVDGTRHVGVAARDVDALAARLDHVIVEADGARGLPFKIPRPGEPVVPPSTTHLVIVVGLAALGKPVREACLDARGIVGEDAVLDAETMRSLILAQHGYLALARQAHRAFVVVNGPDLDSASALARALWHPALRGVIAADSRAGRCRAVTNVDHRVAGIVLAAGPATRMGGRKLEIEVGGIPLVRHAVQAALGAGLSRVCLVTGHRAPDVEEALGPLRSHPRLALERNPDHARGMSSSLRLGLARVRGEADAVMILLADMPAVDTGLAGRVLDVYRRSAARIAAPLVDGRTGHPVILGGSLFDEMDALRGDVGAREIVEENLDRAATFALEDASSQRDVDAPGDLEGFTAGAGA